MKEELADFLRFCAVERRLAPLTCSAYKRDVSACLGYLKDQGSRILPRCGDAPASLPRGGCEASAGAVEPGAGDGGVEVVLPLPRRR